MAIEEKLETIVAVFWYPVDCHEGGETVFYMFYMWTVLLESTLSCEQEKAQCAQLQQEDLHALPAFLLILICGYCFLLLGRKNEKPCVGALLASAEWRQHSAERPRP